MGKRPIVVWYGASAFPHTALYPIGGNCFYLRRGALDDSFYLYGVFFCW